MGDSFFNTDKGKSLIKLILWLVFIIILVLFFRSSEGNKDNVSDTSNEEVIDVTFKEYALMQNELLTLDYTYKYLVSDNTMYQGNVCNNITNGYKENEDGIIKYQIIDDIAYKVELDKKTEISDLYKEEDKIYLDINNLFEDLKHYMYTTEKQDNKRIITYKKDGYQVIVYTSIDNITNINVTNNDKTYNLEFTNIGKCDNIE